MRNYHLRHAQQAQQLINQSQEINGSLNRSFQSHGGVTPNTDHHRMDTGVYMNQMIDPSTTATGLLSSHNIIPQQTFHPAENATSMQNSAQNLSRSFAATSSCNVRKSAVMKQIQKDQRRQQSNPPRPLVNNLDITSNSIGASHQIPQNTGMMFQSEKRNPNHSLLSTGQLVHPSQVGGYLLPGSTGNFVPAHP